MAKKEILNAGQYQKLQKEIADLLSETKRKVQELANTALASCYWQIGKRISSQNLSDNANYQNLLLQNLEQDLKIDKKTLSKALRFYQTYPSGIKEGLSWTHYRHLITVKDEKSREILAKQSQLESWSVRQLESNIKQLNDGGSLTGLEPALGQNAKKNTLKNTKKIKRPTDPSYLYRAKIVNVVDGDTLILNIDLGFGVIKKQRVRLAQIDAPERKTKAGQKSHHYLRDLCARIEEIAVKTNKVDMYGRFLADIFYMEGDLKRGTTQNDIFTKGVYLSNKLVEEGVAEVF